MDLIAILLMDIAVNQIMVWTVTNQMVTCAQQVIKLMR
jgi:hypothetical protein